MKLKAKTIPDISENSPKHIWANENKTENQWAWLDSRNVVDKFKNIPDEEIRKELKRTSNPFAVCAENFIYDFNLATLIRNSNAFNAREVFYIGNKRFNRVGAVGTYNYTDLKWIPTIDEYISLKSKYKFVGIDNVEGSIGIENYEWEENSLLIFGSENVGLTQFTRELCDVILNIGMYGSVRSINVGSASSIVFYDFCKKINSRKKNIL